MGDKVGVIVGAAVGAAVLEAVGADVGAAVVDVETVGAVVGARPVLLLLVLRLLIQLGNWSSGRPPVLLSCR